MSAKYRTDLRAQEIADLQVHNIADLRAREIATARWRAAMANSRKPMFAREYQMEFSSPPPSDMHKLMEHFDNVVARATRIPAHMLSPMPKQDKHKP
jgi:hypothetical protein